MWFFEYIEAKIKHNLSIGLKLKENKIITHRINKYIEMEKKILKSILLSFK